MFPPLIAVETLESGLYACLTMVFGLAIIWYSYHRHRQRRLIQDTATSEVQSASVGATELIGTVERAADSVPAPFSGDSCAVVEYQIDEYKWGDDGKEWKTQDRGLLTEPFYLNDGTDRILIDPGTWYSDYDISDENRRKETYTMTENQPELLTEFIAEHTSESPSSDNKRRYEQKVIPIGEEAYVFGDAEIADSVDMDLEPADDASELVITEDLDTEMFLISDKDEDQLIDDRQFSLLLGGVFGVGVFCLGLAWLLSLLGI